MSINSQPSSIKADGTGLEDWLKSVAVQVVQQDGKTTITTDRYNVLLQTDPWLEQFAESGVLATVAELPAQDAPGNEGSDSSNSSNSSNGSEQGQTGAGSDAGAGGTGDPDQALTLALSSFLKSAQGQYVEAQTPPEYTATQAVIDAALAADPNVQKLLDNGTLAVAAPVVPAGQSNNDPVVPQSTVIPTTDTKVVDAGNGAPTANADTGAAAGTDVGNGGAAPAANGNSTDATNSGTPSGAPDAGKSADSSQGSGSSSDASQPSNTPSGGTPSSPDVSGNTPAPSPTPIVSPQPSPVAPVTETSGAIAYLEKIAETASVDARAIINSIIQYMRAMAPGKSQTPENIQRQQMNLHAALTGAINRLEGDFKSVWGGILRAFHEHGGEGQVFHERYVFRQLENVPLAKDQREAFTRIVNMISLTADPQGRKAGLKQFDKDRTMQYGMTEAGRNKLLSFYDL